jgi:hypothetical protein
MYILTLYKIPYNGNLLETVKQPGHLAISNIFTLDKVYITGLNFLSLMHETAAQEKLRKGRSSSKMVAIDEFLNLAILRDLTVFQIFRYVRSYCIETLYMALCP